jgi:hypothetical protein
MTDSADRIQGLTSRVGALHIAPNETLARLKILYGPNARSEIEAVREDVINLFKNSGIPPDRELEHAKVVRPAIDVLDTIFDSALAGL